jgi:hypothetical protein
MKVGLFSFAALALLFLSSCSPVYVKNFRYETYVRAARYDKAAEFLDNSKFYQKKRNRLLFLLEKGKILHLQQNFAESNTLFNEADNMIEDLSMDIGSEALSLLTNDQMRPYRPEDFEAIGVHFYKALNYMGLGRPGDALVEARRMNLTLNRIDDKYPDHKNRYQSDALANILMGTIYESTGDFNNAFIAYRNAVKLFEDNQGTYMGVSTPEQLKEDVLRSAAKTGLNSEVSFYERKWGMRHRAERRSEGGFLFLFWENGLGPVKSEWNVNFTIAPLGDNRYEFINNDLGLSFPFEYENKKDKDKDKDKEDEDDNIGIEDIQFLRVAFPRYVSRPFQSFGNAQIQLNGRQKFSPSLVEDFDVIARKSLQDRFFREAAKGLLRLATKKLSELSLRKESDTAGAILGVVNAITEKADTRNWQTLPANISYVRIPLRRGANTLTITTQSAYGQIQEEITIQGTGRTQFLTCQTFSELQNISPRNYYQRMEAERNPFLEN